MRGWFTGEERGNLTHLQCWHVCGFSALSCHWAAGAVVGMLSKRPHLLSACRFSPGNISQRTVCVWAPQQAGQAYTALTRLLYFNARELCTNPSAPVFVCERERQRKGDRKMNLSSVYLGLFYSLDLEWNGNISIMCTSYCTAVLLSKVWKLKIFLLWQQHKHTYNREARRNFGPVGRLLHGSHSPGQFLFYRTIFIH